MDGSGARSVKKQETDINLTSINATQYKGNNKNEAKCSKVTGHIVHNNSKKSAQHQHCLKHRPTIHAKQHTFTLQMLRNATTFLIMNTNFLTLSKQLIKDNVQNVTLMHKMHAHRRPQVWLTRRDHDQ